MGVGAVPFRALPEPARRHVRLFQGHQFLDRLAMGLTVAVTVLALRGRGMEVAEIGALFAIYAAVAMATELPFGGLADGLGRKPVFVLATLSSLAAGLVFLLSAGFWALAASFALVGLGRALRSGTLDAWYVEGLRARAPGADIQPLLAGAQAAGFAGLGIGAILGGLLPSLGAGADAAGPLVGRTAYDVSYAAGMVMTGAVLVYTALLVHEPARARDAAAILREARAVPATVRDGARLATSSPAVSLLLAALAFMLFATNPVEVLWPAAMEAIHGPDALAALVGILTAGYFLAIAAGAWLAAALGRRAGGRHAAALAAALGGLALCQVALAWQGTTAGFVLAFAAFSVVLGLAESPAAAILHANVPDHRRSTLLSLHSLVKQLGAMGGLVVAGALTEAWGLPVAWTCGAGALVVGASLAVLLAGVGGGRGPGPEGPRAPSREGAGRRRSA